MDNIIVALVSDCDWTWTPFHIVEIYKVEG